MMGQGNGSLDAIKAFINADAEGVISRNTEHADQTFHRLLSEYQYNQQQIVSLRIVTRKEVKTECTTLLLPGGVK